MVDLGKRQGPLRLIHAPATSIDRAKRVRLRRRPFHHLLVNCVAPCLGFHLPNPNTAEDNSHVGTAVGTFYGYRRGHVNFCIEGDRSRGARPPLLLLEFSIPTCNLARELQHGANRVALECDKARSGLAPSLFDVRAWSVYFNGRRLGFAVRREMEEADAAAFELMKSVSMGAGVLPMMGTSGKGELMYMRARFERVAGSVDSETFHMVNPNGCSGQELSVFFLRS